MKDNINAYILAGGKSSRMGMDKGLQLLHDKPVIQYVMDILKEVFENIFIISAEERYGQFGIPLLQDIFPDKGPAGGIDTALHHADSEKIFIVSCDMPFIDAVSVRTLIALSKEHPITLAKNEEFIEPMFSVISVTSGKKWREMLLQNTFKLSDLISQFDTNFVDAKLFTGQNPRLFVNVNTPGDLVNAALWMKK